MNTNPSTKRIFCYGDSLTFGDDPVSNTRHAANVRWTGVLQNSLGDGYEVIEEGMGGRTTNLDDPEDPSRNGLAYFKATMQSHIPLDMVILMLGTNDLKEKFNCTVKEIAESFRDYDTAIKKACDDWGFLHPKVLLLSPPLVDEAHTPKDWGFVGTEEKSKQFALEYQNIANELGFEFLDLAPIATPSKVDGVHLEASENKKICEVLADTVLKVV